MGCVWRATHLEKIWFTHVSALLSVVRGVGPQAGLTRPYPGPGSRLTARGGESHRAAVWAFSRHGVDPFLPRIYFACTVRIDKTIFERSFLCSLGHMRHADPFH